MPHLKPLPRQLSLFPDENKHYQRMERLLELLLEPVGRARRKKAVMALRRQQTLGRVGRLAVQGCNGAPT